MFANMLGLVVHTVVVANRSPIFPRTLHAVAECTRFFGLLGHTIVVDPIFTSILGIAELTIAPDELAAHANSV